MACKSEVVVDVRFYETDLMGIVHHSNYIRYFELGRTHLLKDMGLPIERIENEGYSLPVVNVEAVYKASARMGDTLRIVSIIEQEPMAKIRVKNQIFNNENDVLLCEGEVVIGFTNKSTGRPCRAPQFFIDTYRKHN